MTATSKTYEFGGISMVSVHGWQWRLPAMSVVFLAILSQWSYPWFHSLIEMFTVVIGVSLYLIAVQTFVFTCNRYLMVVAIGFFWSSIVDIFHALTYEGMGRAGEYPPDTPPLLWMCARTLQVVAFLTAPRLANRHWSMRHIFVGFGMIAAVMTVAVFQGYMPTAWIAGQGLTPFKIAWERVLILGYCVGALQIMQKQVPMEELLRRALLLVMAMGIATELCFTWYVAMYGLSNMVGHIFKLAAYWGMLLVIGQYMLTLPRTLLREQTDLLSKIVRQVPGMTCVFERTSEGRCRMPYVSPSIVSILELSAEDVRSEASSFFDRVTSEYKEHLTAVIEDCARRKSAWSSAWEVVLPRQGRRWLQGSSSVPEILSDGTCVWVAHIHDITEEKRMEQELMGHRDRLSALVGERTEELGLALQRAENSARAKSVFLANMSHEIRTPLNAIVGLAQVGLRNRHVQVAWPYLSQIQDSGRFLMSLINDVLDMAKVDAGKLSLEARPIDLEAVLQRAVTLMLPHAQAKNLSLRLNCVSTLPEAIIGDENRLLQVVMNFLSNGIKFTERGGVSIEAIANLDGNSGTLVLSVIDTGIGIAPEQIERLFMPFEQATSSTARQYGGTGLGLTICRQVVELMGGRIDVSSQPAVGSCFSVRLPIQLAHKPVAVVQKGSIGLGRLQGVRVLAAEDDAVNQWVLRELLEQEGAQCTLHISGMDALQDLRGDQPFDVFITDIQMPGLDGFETARQALQCRPCLPVLGLTAFAMPEDRQKCLDAGMLHHISKPVDADDLVRTIQGVLQQSGVASDDSRAERLTTPVPSSSAQVDWAALQKTLRRTESQVKFLRTFIESYTSAPTQLRELLRTNVMEDLQRLVHKIHGACGFLCATQAQRKARTIEEHILHTGNVGLELVADLAQTLEAVLQEAGIQMALLEPQVA